MKEINITKTQNIICEAMKELLKESPYEKISVQDLVAKSGVSRSSFYNHFTNKDDVIRLIIIRLCENIVNTDEYQNKDSFDKEYITSIRRKLLDYNRDHLDDILTLYKAGFGTQYNRELKTRLFELRQLFDYEYADENGEKHILSDGVLYDLKTWSDVNYTISTLELYFEKYSDMSTEEFDKMIEKAWRLKMTGNFYRKK